MPNSDFLQRLLKLRIAVISIGEKKGWWHSELMENGPDLLPGHGADALREAAAFVLEPFVGSCTSGRVV